MEQWGEFKNSSFIELQSHRDEKVLKGHLVISVSHSKISYTHIGFDRCLANLFFTDSEDGNLCWVCVWQWREVEWEMYVDW